MKRIFFPLLFALLGCLGSHARASAADGEPVCHHCQSDDWVGGELSLSDGGCDLCTHDSRGQSGWFAGDEYLYIRTHFSEALAFARVNDSVVGGVFTRRVTADELDFDYENSFRAFVGYHLNDCADIRFTYWNLDVDTHVNGVAGAGQAIVDPFGGYAPTGASIATSAAVAMNIYDLEYVRPLHYPRPNLGFEYSAGVRFADVDQFYDSIITNGGAVTSRGEWTADFFGVGPHLSMIGRVTPPRASRVSLMSKLGVALLVGSYDVDAQQVIPGAVDGGQSADRTRMVPVMEAELGVDWNPVDALTVTAGWMFQSWWNLGASGGTFDLESTPLAGDAAFVGADDSDTMSFDGLFIRSQVEF